MIRQNFAHIAGMGKNKMKIIKKILVPIMIFACAFSMCACSKKEEVTEAVIEDDVTETAPVIDDVDLSIEEAINSGADRKYKVKDKDISDEDIKKLYSEISGKVSLISNDAVTMLNNSKEGYTITIVIPNGTDDDYNSVVEGYDLELVTE